MTATQVNKFRDEKGCTVDEWQQAQYILADFEDPFCDEAIDKAVEKGDFTRDEIKEQLNSPEEKEDILELQKEEFEKLANYIIDYQIDLKEWKCKKIMDVVEEKELSMKKTKKQKQTLDEMILDAEKSGNQALAKSLKNSLKELSKENSKRR